MTPASIVPRPCALRVLAFLARVLIVAPSAVPVAATPAGAQGLSMLMPVAPRYEIGGFEYAPPEGDGWREVSSSPQDFRIVYAERVDVDKINTRAEFWLHAFRIDTPAAVPDALRLTLVSFDQRKKERGDTLVAHSKIELLAGTAGIHTYSLVTKIGGTDTFETFYVLLAPDKSAYVAGKLLTRDPDYDKQPYYAPFLRSLATLVPPAASTAPRADSQTAPPGTTDD